MGVPALFRWLSQKYPLITSPVYEEEEKEIDGVVIPLDIRKPHPNPKDEVDNLYLDMNGIVHPCSHPEDRPPPQNEEEMMLEVFKYTDRVVCMTRPRKVLMIAVDGVAPRAKMNQQRSRRFRSAQEARQKDDERMALLAKLKEGGGTAAKLDDSPEAEIIKKTWDSNSITPGTPFMDILALSLRYWIAYKLNNDPGWAQLKVIISDATVPGEGEHKIMEFVRSQRRSKGYDPNTRHVIYGLDADLIMLGIATHEAHFRVLREDVFAQEGKQRLCRLCNQPGHFADQCKGEAKVKNGEFDEKEGSGGKKPFIWLHVPVLREYLEIELQFHGLDFQFDLERALDDWVFMCFFVGNDFLPHLPSLEIRDKGIDMLIKIWKSSLGVMGGYVTKDGVVNLGRAQHILSGLGAMENDIFKKRKEAEDRREAAAKRRQEMQDRKRAREDGPSRSAGDDYRGEDQFASVVTVPAAKKSRKLGSEPTGDDVVTYNPGNYEERRAALEKAHERFANRKEIYQASLDNKSAAQVLKESIAKKKASGASTPATEPAEPTEPEPVEVVEVVTATAESTEAVEPVEQAAKTEKQETAATTEKQETAAKTEKQEPEEAVDTVRLWEDGYADRYYEQKFKVDRSDTDFRRKVGHAYVEGLCWVLRYYYQGCPSWTWYYPYHYAPFAADFDDLAKLEMKFEMGIPFRPFEQLMAVLPAASSHAIPEPFRNLMMDPDSPIIDFYPADFPIDLNGKKFAWQGVALLPFIDEARLLGTMATRYPDLTEDDVARNIVGEDALLFSYQNPLYADCSKEIYGKGGADKAVLKPEVSAGLAGTVGRAECFLPDSELVYPLTAGQMPDLMVNNSMTVSYFLPEFGADDLHESKILPGAVFAPAIVDKQAARAHLDRMSNGRGGYGGRGPVQVGHRTNARDWRDGIPKTGEDHRLRGPDTYRAPHRPGQFQGRPSNSTGYQGYDRGSHSNQQFRPRGDYNSTGTNSPNQGRWRSQSDQHPAPFDPNNAFRGRPAPDRRDGHHSWRPAGRDYDRGREDRDRDPARSDTYHPPGRRGHSNRSPYGRR